MPRRMRASRRDRRRRRPLQTCTATMFAARRLQSSYPMARRCVRKMRTRCCALRTISRRAPPVRRVRDNARRATRRALTTRIRYACVPRAHSSTTGTSVCCYSGAAASRYHERPRRVPAQRVCFTARNKSSASHSDSSDGGGGMCC